MTTTCPPAPAPSVHAWNDAPYFVAPPRGVFEKFRPPSCDVSRNGISVVGADFSSYPLPNAYKVPSGETCTIETRAPGRTVLAPSAPMCTRCIGGGQLCSFE